MNDTITERTVPTTVVTTSLWGCALAMIRGVQLLEVLPKQGRFDRNAFLLDNTDDLARLALDDYWRSDPAVPLRTLIAVRNGLLERLDIASPRAARGA
jgi:hypothetical protein